MAFKPQSDSEDAMSEINVTPLVDVMLVLVIILLVTAPLLTQSINVTLPKTAETVAIIKQPPLVLAIDAHGAITLNKKPYGRAPNGGCDAQGVVAVSKIPQADLDALGEAFKNELVKDPETALHLYPDQSAVYATIAEIMATAHQAGITKMSFVSEEK
jgi:biopolymer transport protein ExbD